MHFGKIHILKIKTNITNSFLSVYKKLEIIRFEMDRKLKEIDKNDKLKKRYTSELVSHYKQIHNRVNVFLTSDEEKLKLSITGSSDNFGSFTTYYIDYNFSTNKYLLKEISYNDINKKLL